MDSDGLLEKLQNIKGCNGDCLQQITAEKDWANLSLMTKLQRNFLNFVINWLKI